MSSKLHGNIIQLHRLWYRGRVFLSVVRRIVFRKKSEPLF